MPARGRRPRSTAYAGGNIRSVGRDRLPGTRGHRRTAGGHGFTTADGVVLEGKVHDLATQRPVAARVRLQRIEPQAKGGYHYTVVAQAVADAQGRLGPEKGTGRLAADRGRGRRLCAEDCRLRPVRRPARLALLRLRAVSPRVRVRAALATTRASRWRTWMCGWPTSSAAAADAV